MTVSSREEYARGAMMLPRAALALRRGSCLAVAVALVLTALPATRALGTEATLPEEALFRRLVVLGEVDAARDGFAALLAEQFAALPPLEPAEAAAGDTVARRAALVEGATRTLRVWETGEVRLRRSGTATPDPVLERIAGALDTLAPHAALLATAAGDTATADQSPGARRLRRANAQVGELFLLSTAFFRDTKLAKRRGDLLAAARRHAPAPTTLADLDARGPRSADEAFGFGPSGPPTAPAPATAAPRPLRVDDASLEDLVQRYCRAFAAGDLAALKPLFVPGRFPKRALAHEVQKLSGWELAGIGRIQARDLGADEIEVNVDGITLRGPGGETRATRDRLIVRRMADGSYRIARLGGAP